MKAIKKTLLFLSAVPLALIFHVGATKAEIGQGSLDDEPILVGRISHIEGQLYRYQPGDEAWTPTLVDTPFGAGENLYTEGNSRAEIILPNGTWARLDGCTRVQLVQLIDDLTDLDLGSGTGRFYNKGSYSFIEVRTVFGDVTAPAGTVFDLHLYSNAVEVIALRGAVDFIAEDIGQRYQVTAGMGSIVADTHAVSARKGYEPPGWDSWNLERDALWAAGMRSGEISAAYLPPGLRDEAYVLDENGTWEGVYYDDGYYDDGYYYFWRPTHVALGWSPFTVGYWTTWYHENTWFPCEPFGYVTHHYGNWVFIGNSWYWAPPVSRIHPHIQRPLLNIGFAWYPGRVAWIQSGINVGWVSLAPHEPYYAHRRWGQRVVVMTDRNAVDLNVTVNSYKNYRHAVVIDRNDLYRMKNYKALSLTRVGTSSIAGKYHAVGTLDRIVSRPMVDGGNVRHAIKTAPKTNSYFMFAGKTGINRLEKVPGLKKPENKISAPAGVSWKQKTFIHSRNTGVSVTDSAGPSVSEPFLLNQNKIISVKPGAVQASAALPRQRVTQTSLRTSQVPGPRIDRRRVSREESRRPMTEMKVSNPAKRNTLNPKYESASIRHTTNEAVSRSRSSFIDAKGSASANRNWTEMRRQTQLTTQPRPYSAKSVSKGNGGASRIQPSSRRSMGGSKGGFLRD